MADFVSTYGGGGNGAPRNERMSITTSMFTLWDEAGNQLRLSCLDNGMSVAIWVPYFSPDGRRQYPVEQRFSTVLQSRMMEVLSTAIRDNIIPAYASGNTAKIGVFTNTAHSNMLEVEVREGAFYVHLHRNCDPINHIPQSSIKFKFDVYNIIKGYDPDSGSMETEPIQADFFIFAKAIEAFNTMAGGMMAGHGVRMTTSHNNKRMMEYLEAIAREVHAQLPAPASYGPRTGMYGQNNINPGAVGMNPIQPAAPSMGSQMPLESEVQEVNNITDLM